jgi:hypothetical protein
MERGDYFLRTPPPEEPRELPEEPREADPELRDEEPRETLPDLPDDELTRARPDDLDEEPIERPDEGLSAVAPEDGREKGPENVRALARPPSP